MGFIKSQRCGRIRCLTHLRLYQALPYLPTGPVRRLWSDHARHGMQEMQTTACPMLLLCSLLPLVTWVASVPEGPQQVLQLKAAQRA